MDKESNCYYVLCLFGCYYFNKKKFLIEKVFFMFFNMFGYIKFLSKSRITRKKKNIKNYFLKNYNFHL